MRLGSAADFENGPLYTMYRRYPFFAEWAEKLQARYGNGQKTLLVGCGWGFLVDELLKLGWDVWGCDASAYCITKRTTELPALSAARIMQASVLSSTEMNSVRTFAGLTGNRRFNLCVTEDLLTVLSDAEITTALPILRGICGTLAHIVTPGDPVADAGSLLVGLNWKTMAEWKALVGNEVVINASTGEFL